MPVLLNVRELSKSYAHRRLFSGLSLALGSGEKIGLIGPNGAGKSTLLKILAGLEVPDDGECAIRRGSRIGYVPQDDTFPADRSVHDVVIDALAEEAMEDYERETRATIALAQVGFDDPEKLAGTLSGGWRKRLAFARALAREPEFLLLDEPTNHLDLPGVVWLEKLLRAAPFGYLVATHDRAFLRAVADEVVEVSRAYPGGVFRAEGGFDAFDEKRNAFLESQERQREAVANQVRKETDWLGRKESAQRSKSRARIGIAADRRAELAELNARTNAPSGAAIDFSGTGRQTRKLVTATGISKSLGGNRLFGHLDLILSPGSVVGLLGANGSGKSTLLKVLAKTLEPDTGSVTHADGLRAEVFEQGRSSLDLSLTLRAALSPNGDNVMYRGQPMHVGGWARRFLFHSEQLEVQLGALSGGEQARIRIAQLMLRPADLLLLDEPTNDLDIPTLEVLEESLTDFPGAVVLVSHDRELMDRLCTEYIGLDHQGGAKLFGSVDQWLASLEPTESSGKPEAKAAKPVVKAAKAKKLSYKEQQEFDGIEAAILEAEEEVTQKQAVVETAAASGAQALVDACRELDAAQRTVEQLYARWQELEAKRSG